jgi:succinyl-CoA synthetase beta subunit
VKLHEYQAKTWLAQYGVPVPHGRIATTPQAAYTIARDLAGPVVVKAQVQVEGRGKFGGIRFARSPEQAEEYAHSILGMVIQTYVVRKVLVEPAANILNEIYLGITNDRAAGRPIIMASADGGIDIERIAHEDPERVTREHIDPFRGLLDYQARNLASGINLAHEYWKVFTHLAKNLSRCYLESDAELLEINPLVLTREGRLLALDSKIVIDDNALYRQPQLAEMRDGDGEPREEARARAMGISYVKLDGNIGCMVNGAGLAMTTVDMVRLYGGKPSNFLDIGGGAQANKVAAALKIILADTSVKSILLNIFGGITRCDEVARGILLALAEVNTTLPLFVRLAGTNAEEGRAILEGAGIPTLSTAGTLSDAAHQAIAAVQA